MSTRTMIVIGVISFVVLGFSAAVVLAAVLLWNPLQHYRAEELVRQGKVLVHDGNQAGALEKFEQAVEVDPHDGAAWISLGFGQAAAGKYSEALATGDAAVAALPNRSAGYAIRAFAHRALKNYPQARDDYETLLRFAPNSAFYHAELGVVLVLLPDENAAMAEFDKALQLKPDLTLALYYRAKLRVKRYDFAGAQGDAARLNKLEPNNADYHATQAQIALFMGDLPAAEDACAAALRISPKSYAALFYQSAVRRRQGDLKGALDNLDQAIAADPRGAAFFDRGIVKFEQDDLAGAREDLVRGRNSSHRPFAELWLWMVDTRLAHRDEADRDLSLYLSNARRAKAGLWTETMGDVLLGRVTPEAAAAGADTETSTVGRNNDLCDLWFYAAQFSLAKGDKAAAKAYLEKSVATKAVGEMEYGDALVQLKAL